MTQIQNRTINQFLQSKTNHNHYNSLLKSTNITEPYFNKNLFTKTSTRIAPHFDTLNEEDKYNDNILKLYNKNLQTNNKNYYKINKHNHSEYIANNSSKNSQKIIMNRRGNLKTHEVIKKNSPENYKGYYNKTEDNNAIRRTMSSTYKRGNGNDDTPNNKNNQKKYFSNRKENKRIEIIQSSPSQPLLFKDNDIEEKNRRKLFKKTIRMWPEIYN